MPANPSSRCHASSTEGAYCILEFFDNSSVKLRLICAESAAKEIHPGESYAPIFAPSFRARLTLTVRFHCRDFHHRVSILPSRTPSDEPVLPCPYLNNRSILSQVRSAHSYRSFLPRKFIASFNNARFFSFVWTSPGSKVCYFHFSNDKRTQPER